MTANVTADGCLLDAGRERDVHALTKEVGAVGMARFFRQLDIGEGDYTAEREALLADITMDDIEAAIGAASVAQAHGQNEVAK